MSVVLEFTVENDQFTLGQVLSGPPPMDIELERVIPTGNAVIPFLWVAGEDHEAFEEKVRHSEYVADLHVLDRVEDSDLYRVTWIGDHEDIILGINESDATILDAHGNDGWEFDVRFNDHDALSKFHNYCTDHGIRIHVKRTYPLTERTEGVHQFDLSNEQREALILALREGYFETPSQVSLSELADELGITQQAISNRIRRGNKKILGEALLSSAVDYE